jgi:hypothetical protein
MAQDFEHQIASHDMGVKPVFSFAVFPDRIPKPALGIAEPLACNVSELYRRPRTAHARAGSSIAPSESGISELRSQSRIALRVCSSQVAR